MTLDEAKAEARRRWGERGGADRRRDTDPAFRACVGIVGMSGNAVVFGHGKTFEDAFAMADERGITPAKVASATKKAEGRLNRRILLEAFKGLFT